MSSPLPDGSNAGPAIFWSGLIAGILDISDALVFYGLRGAKPIRILQSIASGLLGPKSFQGGWSTAALGLACHFVIAYGAAVVFYVASRKLRFLTDYAVISGLAFGGAVYLFMNRIVLPLSRVSKPAAPPSGLVLVNAVLAVMIFVGLTIALVVRRYAR